MTGTITERDEHGRIMKGGKALAPEEAAEMARRRWQKPIDEDTTALLSEAGYSEDAPPPTILRKLAEQIAKGGGGAVAAAREFMRLTHAEGDGALLTKPKPGELCPACGQIVRQGIEREVGEVISEAASFLARMRKEEEISTNSEANEV